MRYLLRVRLWALHALTIPTPVCKWANSGSEPERFPTVTVSGEVRPRHYITAATLESLLLEIIFCSPEIHVFPLWTAKRPGRVCFHPWSPQPAHLSLLLLVQMCAEGISLQEKRGKKEKWGWPYNIRRCLHLFCIIKEELTV